MFEYRLCKKIFLLVFVGFFFAQFVQLSPREGVGENTQRVS